MSGKLLWTGLTLIMAAQVLTGIPEVKIVGAVIMVIGCVLLILDK